MPKELTEVFDLSAEIPVPRPFEKEDWSINHAVAQREWNDMLSSYGGVEHMPATELLRYHLKWWYAAGHKFLGRLYNDQSNSLGLKV